MKSENSKDIIFEIKEGLKEFIDLIDDVKLLNIIWIFFDKIIPKLRNMNYID